MTFKTVFCLSIFTLSVTASILISCGPSPKEQAAISLAMTASAVTDTPSLTTTNTPYPTQTPTVTPTPIPYELTVLVAGIGDAPVSNAEISLIEVDDESSTQITNDDGQATWHDLPGEDVHLSISAQGYITQESSETLERGANQISIALEQDPYGLLPSEVCAPGERLLYVDDFQDGYAQGWPDIEHRASGWDIGSNPDIPEDTVILHSSHNTSALNDSVIYENAVWRFQYMISGPRTIIMHWHKALEPYEIEEGWVDQESTYQVWFQPRNLYAIRVTLPIWVQELLYTNLWNPIGVWQNVEISTYEGVYQVWRDGRRLLKYTDPQPLPGGGILIQSGQTADPDSIIYFNNFSICELTAPFVTMPTPSP